MILEKVMEEEVNIIIAIVKFFHQKHWGIYILVMSNYTSDLPVCYVRVTDCANTLPPYL